MTNYMDPQADVFDEELALSSVGGDREFLTEMVGLVQAAWPSLLNGIRGGMASRDLAAIQKGARLGKAAARNVSARNAYDSCLQLEGVAGAGDLHGVQAAITRLEHEVERLRPLLTAFATAVQMPQ
jgi:HPt (histidine-containing phosphotransfer) domain-containing protein